MIIYLNTASQNLVNVEISHYFKRGEDWNLTPASKAPFITRSVQTFYLGEEDFDNNKKPKLHSLDCLRIGISGSLGSANYSTFVEYPLPKILVIKNRDELRNYEGFWNVDENITTLKFKEMFAYYPKGTKTMDLYFRVKPLN